MTNFVLGLFFLTGFASFAQFNQSQQAFNTHVRMHQDFVNRIQLEQMMRNAQRRMVSTESLLEKTKKSIEKSEKKLNELKAEESSDKNSKKIEK